MKIISIDVGIKNLSFCLFEIDIISKNIKILKWDNINLSVTDKNDYKCIEIDKKGLCNKPAKFSKDDKCYCLKHSKLHNYLQPTSDLKEAFLKKQKLQKLIDIADKYKLTYETPLKKLNILNVIQEFIQTNCYTPIAKTNATKVDLVTIGRNIQEKFNNIFSDIDSIDNVIIDNVIIENQIGPLANKIFSDINSIDNVIIENQIGPLANKMKTIQGMISQYFIMTNNNIIIDFVSASNKLKDYLPKEKIDYKQRKKLGIETCLTIVNSDLQYDEWRGFVNKHTKKDDLSDCFLQGLWFIKYRVLMNC